MTVIFNSKKEEISAKNYDEFIEKCKSSVLLNDCVKNNEISQVRLILNKNMVNLEDFKKLNFNKDDELYLLFQFAGG